MTYMAVGKTLWALLQALCGSRDLATSSYRLVPYRKTHDSSTWAFVSGPWRGTYDRNDILKMSLSHGTGQSIQIVLLCNRLGNRWGRLVVNRTANEFVVQNQNLHAFCLHRNKQDACPILLDSLPKLCTLQRQSYNARALSEQELGGPDSS